MFTKIARPLLFNGVSPSLMSIRPLSISNIFFQGATSKSNSVAKSSKGGNHEFSFFSEWKYLFNIILDEKSLVEEKKGEKVLRVEDSLKDLSSIKWRSEHNGKRLWPHDQWPERDLVNYPPYKLREVPHAVRWYCVPETWFKFFYDKTGVIGPYMFFYGLLIYGFSK